MSAATTTVSVNVDKEKEREKAFDTFPPLFQAIQKKDVRKVRELIASGVDVNESHSYTLFGQIESVSPLHEVVRRGLVLIVREFLKVPMLDINKLTDEGTALMIAVMNNNEQIIKDLLKHHEIDVNAATPEGKTALCMAVERNYIDAVRLLIEHPKIDLNPICVDKTPLQIALDKKYADIVVLLMKQHKKGNTLALQIEI